MQGQFNRTEEGKTTRSDQVRLPFDADRNERKALINAVHHSRTGLGETQWGCCQEVLTYMVHVATDRGMFPSIDTIAKGCDMSQRAVTRAIADLRALGVLSQRRRGRKSARYEIHFAAIAALEVSTDSAPFDPPFDPPNTPLDPPTVRVGAPVLADRTTGFGGSAIKGINQEPTKNQPTTTAFDPPNTPTDDWNQVVVEVFGCGVNQAKAAVEAARILDATPADVRAIAAHWREHRDAWQHAETVLYHRLRRFDAELAADAGWPPFAEAYQAKLDREAGRKRDLEIYQRQFARRREHAAAREAAQREHVADPQRLMRLIADVSPELAEGVQHAQARERVALRRLDPVATAALVADRREQLRRLAEREQQPRPPPGPTRPARDFFCSQRDSNDEPTTNILEQQRRDCRRHAGGRAGVDRRQPPDRPADRLGVYPGRRRAR